MAPLTDPQKEAYVAKKYLDINSKLFEGYH